MNFSNSQQFELYFGRVLQKVVNGIADEILGALKQSIDKNTYALSGLPNVAYLGKSEDGPTNAFPSFEFRDKAWIVDKAHKIANEIVGGVDYFPMGMSAPSQSNPYKHGNYFAGKDRRNQLAELLNVYGYADNADFRKSTNPNSDGTVPSEVKREKRRAPFFDKTIEWIDKNWDNLVVKHFRRQGIEVSVAGASGNVTAFKVSVDDVVTLDHDFSLDDVF